MSTIQITSQFDILDVAKNIEYYNFDSPISLDDFIKLFENMSPVKYRNLMYNNVLSNVNEIIPDDVVEVLVSSGSLYYDDFVCESKLTPSMIKKLISSNESVGLSLISNQKLTLPQFKTIIKTSENLDPYDLAEAIGNSRNPEWAKFVIKTWSEIAGMDAVDLKSFQYELFIHFGSLILSDNDSKKIFGKIRPCMSSEELRSHEPCADGWKRTMKWAGRSDTQYSWNEFIARHIMSSTDRVEAAKSDLIWLAESVADSVIG